MWTVWTVDPVQVQLHSLLTTAAPNARNPPRCLPVHNARSVPPDVMRWNFSSNVSPGKFPHTSLPGQHACAALSPALWHPSSTFGFPLLWVARGGTVEEQLTLARSARKPSKNWSLTMFGLWEYNFLKRFLFVTKNLS